jgi:glycosyltransferase involved in cell wall biosynthesis
VKKFPAIRKLIDSTIVAPNVKKLEKKILRAGKIMALSEYAKRSLNEIAGEPIVSTVLPMPVDTAFWSLGPKSRVSGRVGFCGRLSDPRKNVELLLTAVARASASMTAMSAVLIGGEADRKMRAFLTQLHIADRVRFIPKASGPALRDELRSLDLFVVPSHQEGLCIAALEAMACGCPVVSTRCGGPEEFVIDGQTGILVGFDPDEMATAMLKVLNDRKLHAKLAEGARNLVVQHYSLASAESIFWREFEGRFPEPDFGKSFRQVVSLREAAAVSP